MKEMSKNLDHYLRRLGDRKMSVRVSFHSVGHMLNLSVRNDVAISPMELARIKERVGVPFKVESVLQAVKLVGMRSLLER